MFRLHWCRVPATIGCRRAGVAHSVERNLAKVEVAGSKPVSRSTLVLRVQFELDRGPISRHDDTMSRGASPAKRLQRRPKTSNKELLLGPNALFQHSGQTRLDTTSIIPEDEYIASFTASRGRGVHVIANGHSRRNGDHQIGRNEDPVSLATGQRRVSPGRSLCGRLGTC